MEFRVEPRVPRQDTNSIPHQRENLINVTSLKFKTFYKILLRVKRHTRLGENPCETLISWSTCIYNT